MVVIGNAERLTKEAAGQLEWLHGRNPGWALYFVGLPSALARISTEPHLMAALEDTVEIRALSTAELHSVLPKINDLFLTADRDLIDRIDVVLQGNLGKDLAWHGKGLNENEDLLLARAWIHALDVGSLVVANA